MVDTIKVGTVELPLVQCEVKRGKENKGKKYWALDFTKIPFEKLVEAYGVTKLYEDLLQPKFNQFAQTYWFSCFGEKGTPNEGVPNEDEFINNLSALSARGETVAVLMDRLMGLLGQLATCKSVDDFTALRDKIASIKNAIETKKQKTAEDLAEEAAGVEGATA